MAPETVERQVSADEVIVSLKNQIAEMCMQVAIKDAVIKQLEHDLRHLLERIDQLVPTEDIDGDPEG